MRYLSHMLHGCVMVRVHGYSPERFFNLCRNNGLEIWDICYGKDGCTFYMQARQFLKSKPYIRKAGVRLSVVKKLGLPFFLYRNGKRKLYAAGFVSFFLMLYVLSLFIWNIRFEGNRMYSSETLLTFLKSQNIDYGMLKSRVYCEGIEEAMRTEFGEITWVSAQVSGTRLLIHIKENEVLSSIPQKDHSPQEIIAAQPGVIKSMVVRRGVPLVSVGDTVEAGQVLVSGILEITDDSNTVISRHAVRADADITGETVREETTPFSLYRPVSYDTGKTNLGFRLKVGPWTFTALLPTAKEEEWVYASEQRQLKLLEDFYLPVYGAVIRGRQRVTYESLYPETEKQEQIDRIHQNFMDNLIEKGVQILENSVKIQEDGFTCYVISHVRTLERIGVSRPIEEPEPVILPEQEPDQ